MTPIQEPLHLQAYSGRKVYWKEALLLPLNNVHYRLDHVYHCHVR